VIIKKSASELDRMRQAGRVVAKVLSEIRDEIRPGVRTRDLDVLVERSIRREGCTPSFKGYRGFPASACISLNEEIVHGIPGARKLKEGDLLKIDVGAIFEGYHGDSAWTFYVSERQGDSAPPHIERLMHTTEESLWAGIRAARAGNRVGDISHAVQEVVEAAGLSVVREYVGHGVGAQLHEDLQVPNYGPPGRGPILEEGMTIALEPMVNLGDWRTEVLSDDWTVVTADRSLSAHYEHTIAITAGEPEVLTAQPAHIHGPSMSRDQGK
jgi:methionyl aminopeptidase